MDVQNAKDIFFNPQVWPWLFAAWLITTAATKLLERLVDRVTFAKITDWFERFVLLLLIIHAAVGALAAFWCLTFTDYSSPLDAREYAQGSWDRSASRFSGFSLSGVLFVVPFLCARIARTVKRQDDNHLVSALMPRLCLQLT